MERWISLHEKLKEHWVFNDHNALRIWLLLLWDANYKDVKVRIDGKLINVKTGQYVTSIRQLAIRYGFTRYIISRVLDDLEKDGMIIREPIGRVWTLLTIVNYTKYQGKQQKNEKFSASDLTSDSTSNSAGDPATYSPQVNKGYKVKINNKGGEEPLPQITAPKYPTGKFGNVMLTQEEAVKLYKEYPNEAQGMIEHLSEYMKETGRKYANHYGTIQKWIREDREKQKQNQKTQRSDLQREYTDADYLAMERKKLGIQ